MVAQLVRRNEGEITFLGMAGRDSQDAMQEFVGKYGLEGMPQAVSEDGTLWARFGVPYQPAWVFVNDDGTVEVVQGAPPEEQVQSYLDDLKAA